jgi:hypothetical protein
MLSETTQRSFGWLFVILGVLGVLYGLNMLWTTNLIGSQPIPTDLRISAQDRAMAMQMRTSMAAAGRTYGLAITGVAALFLIAGISGIRRGGGRQ